MRDGVGRASPARPDLLCFDSCLKFVFQSLLNVNFSKVNEHFLLERTTNSPNLRGFFCIFVVHTKTMSSTYQPKIKQISTTWKNLYNLHMKHLKCNSFCNYNYIYIGSSFGPCGVSFLFSTLHALVIHYSACID